MSTATDVWWHQHPQSRRTLGGRGKHTLNHKTRGARILLHREPAPLRLPRADRTLDPQRGVFGIQEGETYDWSVILGIVVPVAFVMWQGRRVSRCHRSASSRTPCPGRFTHGYSGTGPGNLRRVLVGFLEQITAATVLKATDELIAAAIHAADQSGTLVLPRNLTTRS